jgi:hypothetical protein
VDPAGRTSNRRIRTRGDDSLPNGVRTIGLFRPVILLPTSSLDLDDGFDSTRRLSICYASAAEIVTVGTCI